jgi:4-amino-4-deoxy-L-arabinose transferase-like glycosyltransferase
VSPPGGVPPPTRTALLGAGGMAVALGVGVLGQAWLDRRPVNPWAWVPLAVAAVGFALLARRDTLERAVGDVAAEPMAPRPWPLAAACALAGLAFPGFAGNLFRPLPTLLWLASLAFLYAAFHPRAGRSRGAPDAGTSPRVLRGWRGERSGFYISSHALALLGVLLVATFLRLYQLDAIPREMGTDMPLIYENAREILHGQLMIFCPRFPGREALFHSLVAATGGVLGLNYLAIKLTSTLVGLASIVALYLLARYLFDRDVALVAAALLAVSKWHVILSRSGYRASMMPLMVALVMLLLARAVDRRRARDYLVAGMTVGLGLYTYNAFMLVPAVAGVSLLAALALRGGRTLREAAGGLAALGLGALGAFLPLGRYALEAPQSYLFRVATRLTGAEVPLPHDLPAVVAHNLERAAGMFNLHGDIVSYINVPDQRHMGVVSGALLLCGLAFAIARWRRGHNAMVLLFLGGMVLPTALALAFPNEVPSAQRASGAIVPACLLAALPLALLWRRLAPLAPARTTAAPVPATPPAWGRMVRPAFLLVVAALLGLELAETSRAYFRDYVGHLPEGNYAISLELARTLDAFAPEGPGYVKPWPYWYDGNAVRAQLRAVPEKQQWEVTELDPTKPPLAGAAKVLVIVNPEDRQALQTLQQAFPCGAAVAHRDFEGRVAFLAFYGLRSPCPAQGVWLPTPRP